MPWMLHFNLIPLINNGTFTNLSGDFGLLSILQELQAQPDISERRNNFMFLNSINY